MRLKAIFLGLSLITIPSFTFSAEEESSIFDEVVVTARKREESAQSVPIPISALDGDRLEARNITEIQDITILLNFDEYLHENPQIVKNLLDKNPSMTVSEANTQAKNIWKN